MYTIEKGVPLPDLTKREVKYPFNVMEPNDSFLIPASLIGKIRAAAAYYKRRHHKVFLVKKISNEEARVWRVE